MKHRNDFFLWEKYLRINLAVDFIENVISHLSIRLGHN